MKITLEITVQLTGGQGKRAETLILNRDRQDQWVCFSPFIGHQWQGDAECENLLFGPSVTGLYEDEGGDNKLVMRLEGIVPGTIVSSIGDTGKGKVYRSAVALADRNVTWEIVPNQ